MNVPRKLLCCKLFGVTHFDALVSENYLNTNREDSLYYRACPPATMNSAEHKSSSVCTELSGWREVLNKNDRFSDLTTKATCVLNTHFNLCLYTGASYQLYKIRKLYIYKCSSCRICTGHRICVAESPPHRVAFIHNRWCESRRSLRLHLDV